MQVSYADHLALSTVGERHHNS